MCIVTDILFQEAWYQRGALLLQRLLQSLVSFLRRRTGWQHFRDRFIRGENDAPKLGPLGGFHMLKFGVGGNACLRHEIPRSQEKHVHFLFYSHRAGITQLDASPEHPLVSH